ncbi:uncharacterized protein LOC133791495 [Humulus lupulus]|uniref:uncharacterized protein LOC133791495 n=1 Tax=Humulus lupulus TaxID=3486 RepID=UPI002B415002|nr:uncharacterized protein LOC133791495 [Humulus lupulus]
MDSVNVFDIYNTPETSVAPPSKKKARKRHPGESSKAPQAKKPRNAGLPEGDPSANATPPSPREQQTPPAPAGSTPPLAAPTDQTQQVGPASTGGDITTRAFKSVKDRVAKIVKHDRCREAMDVDLILNRTLNEFTSAMLTLTVGRLRSGAVTEQAKSLEQRHADELKAAVEKYAGQHAVVLEEKNKLAEEGKEKQKSLDKAIDQRDQTLLKMSLRRSAHNNANASNVAPESNEAPPVCRRGVSATNQNAPPPVDNTGEIARLRQ